MSDNNILEFSFMRNRYSPSDSIKFVGVFLLYTKKAIPPANKGIETNIVATIIGPIFKIAGAKETISFPLRLTIYQIRHYY